MRFFVLLLCSAAIAACSRQGCQSYIPYPHKLLVAHGGGGLADRLVPDNLQAVDLAYKHHFRLIELDFQSYGRSLILAHDNPNEKSTKATDLIRWLALHPGVSIITDFKTDNVSGLKMLAALAGDQRSRFIPQIYQPSEFNAVSRLGFQRPMLTLYRIREPWIRFANAADIQAVVMPIENAAAMRFVKDKPVFLHTINKPVSLPAAGFYTDCMVPA